MLCASFVLLFNHLQYIFCGLITRLLLCDLYLIRHSLSIKHLLNFYKLTLKASLYSQKPLKYHFTSRHFIFKHVIKQTIEQKTAFVSQEKKFSNKAVNQNTGYFHVRCFQTISMPVLFPVYVHDFFPWVIQYTQIQQRAVQCQQK